MGRLGRGRENAFREFQIEEVAVVGQELDSGPAKHGFEVGRREPEFAGSRHASAGRRKAIKLVRGASNRFAADPDAACPRKSTEIAHNGVRLCGGASHAATPSASRAAARSSGLRRYISLTPPDADSAGRTNVASWVRVVIAAPHFRFGGVVAAD